MSDLGVPAPRPPMSWIYLRGGPADGRTIQGLAWGPVIYVEPDPIPVGRVYGRHDEGEPPVDAMAAPLRYVKALPEVGFFVLREDISYPAGTPTALVEIPHDVATVYDYAG